MDGAGGYFLYSRRAVYPVKQQADDSMKIGGGNGDTFITPVFDTGAGDAQFVR